MTASGEQPPSSATTTINNTVAHAHIHGKIRDRDRDDRHKKGDLHWYSPSSLPQEATSSIAEGNPDISEKQRERESGV